MAEVYPTALAVYIADQLGVTMAEVRSETRLEPVVAARAAIAYVLRKRLEMVLTRIGFVLGGQDHTTISAAVRRAEEKLTAEPEFERVVRMGLEVELWPHALPRIMGIFPAPRVKLSQAHDGAWILATARAGERRWTAMRVPPTDPSAPALLLLYDSLPSQEPGPDEPTTRQPRPRAPRKPPAPALRNLW